MEGGAAPAPIELGEMVFALCWLHPPAPLIASGTISGALCLHRLKRGEGGGGSGAGTAAPPTPTLEQRLTHHTDSCRTVCCAGTTKLFSASADKSVALIDLGGSGGGGGGARVSWQQQGAHAAAINVADEVGEASHPAGLIVTGDDEGCLKLWDVRQSKAVMEFHDHEDFVSSVAVEEAQRTLVSCSGDGTLAAYNLRRAKLERRSDQLEDELLSCALLKGEACSRRVVLCGSQDGVLHTYKWGQWADCSDRFPGHPSSIDAIAAFDDDTVMTGSSDGLIRVVTIQPNAFVGVIGDHGEFPVEELVLRWGDDGNSADGAAGQAAPGGGGGGLPPLLASASHDHTVRFWDLSALVDGGESSEDDSDDEDSSDSDSSDSDSSGGGGGGDSQSRRGGGASQQQGPVAQQAAKRRKVLQREAAAGPAARGRRGGGGGGAKLESAAASDFFSDL